MKQVTQKRDPSRRWSRLIGASLLGIPAARWLANEVKVNKVLKQRKLSLPEIYAEAGEKAGDDWRGKKLRFLGRRSPKTLFALGLGVVGLHALAGAVLGRGMHHSYWRSRSQYPSSLQVRAIGAGLVKGPYAAPLIAVRDVRRRLFGKKYGIEGV